MRASTAAAATVLLLATAPSAQAFVLPASSPAAQGAAIAPSGPAPWEARVAAMEHLMALFGGDGTSGSATYASLQENGTDVTLLPLGDIDHDGHADVLLVRLLSSAPGERASVVEARSGADLTHILWSRDSVGQLSAAADLDGDGIRDVRESMFGQFSATSNGQDAAFAAEIDFTFRIPYAVSLLSGRDGSRLANYTLDTTSSAQGAAVFPPLVGASAVTQAQQSASLALSAKDSLLRTLMTQTRRNANACATACAGANTRDRDAQLTFLDAHGKTVATVARADNLADVTQVLGADLDSDGRVDAATLEFTATDGSATPGRLGRVAVHAFNGKDGSESWAVTRDAEPVLFDALSDAGDLDGDGRHELAEAVMLLQPTLDASVTLHLHSGADGHDLATADLGVGGTMVPFGDANGDGKAEALLVRFGTSGITLSAVGPDLKPIWTYDAGASYPLNPDTNGYSILKGFTDLTGDHRPDLLLVGLDAGLTYNGTLVLVSGADGKKAWSLDLKDAVSVRVTAELSGTGAADIALVTAPGLTKATAEGATVTFSALTGETGATLFSQVLRQPSGPVAQKGGIAVDVTDLGDVAADGTPTLALRLREGIHTVETRIESPGRVSVSIHTEFNTTYYLFATGQGKVISSVQAKDDVPPPPATTNTTAPPTTLPDAKVDAGLPRGNATREDATTTSAPTPGPGIVVAGGALAVALVAALRRRRAA